MDTTDTQSRPTPARARTEPAVEKMPGHWLLGRGPIVAEVLGTGTLEARAKTTVSPTKISGRVKTVLVDQGERVNGGQELVYLDDDELRQHRRHSRSSSARCV